MARTGCIATLSSWYVRKELGLRTGLFYTGSMLSGAFSGLLAAGILSGMDGTLGLLAWRWIFITEGTLTVVIALGALFVLPDFPANTRWLTEQERQLAVWRLEIDAAGEEDWTGSSSSSQPLFDGFRMLVVDPVNWILVLVVYGAASSISINSFFPTIGPHRDAAAHLSPYLLACFVCAAVSWNAGRTGERYWHTVGPLACALVGFVVSSAATGVAPRYLGAMVMLPGIYTGFNMSMFWTANTIYRPAAKRAAAVAFNNAVSTLSSIYGSYLYPSHAAPRFVLAFSVNAGMAFMAIVASTALHFVLKGENRKLALRDQEAETDGRTVLVALGVPLDAALVQAGVDAEGDVGRDVLAEALEVGAVDGLHAAEGGGDDVRAEVEEGLGDLLDAWVDVVEAGDEDGVLAVRVELLVDGALGEDGHLEGVHGVGDGVEAVLDDEVGDEAALDDDVELGGAVVDVGRVHAAGAEEGERHGGAVADEGRECLGRGRGREAALAAGLGAGGGAGVVEVEDEVAGLVEQADALLLRRGRHELGDELLVAGAGVDGDDGGRTSSMEMPVLAAGAAEEVQLEAGGAAGAARAAAVKRRPERMVEVCILRVLLLLFELMERERENKEVYMRDMLGR
ncbi:pantothenate transporter liz1 [Colletotrichum higginsianum]|nr:pantothenate transporter liz1 [Colletotrichum higginsianum]